MRSIDEQILRTTKEIVVKYIEAGRLSPTAFHETFEAIFKTVSDTVRKSMKPESEKK
ncbi:conjugal transfer protein TraB [Desulfococcaceae bacterium HSG9]|nr:conjugal transfer protein TraB [Desulfococcaceae bacterium HSG9]